MNWLVNRFIVRPAVTVGCFVKRHPVLVVLAILLMWLLGSFVAFVLKVAGFAVDFVNRVFGQGPAQFVVSAINGFVALIEAGSKGFAFFIFLVGLVSPVLAAFLGIWRFMDSLRPRVPGLPVNPTPAPVATPEDKENPLLFGFPTF